jgi:hypothetical protein
MAERHGRLLTALVLWTVLLAPATALAGPYLGEWGWCWHPARDCPRGEYCPLHYWLPELYKVRANVHPSNLDQYPSGPCPAVPPAFQTINYRCRTIPPTPTTPYADPTGYYGRVLVPE